MGNVDNSGRALLTLRIRAAESEKSHELVVWIDTGFDGDLVVSRSIIELLGPEQSAGVQATLADGTSVILETYRCWVDWLGELRQVEVVANEGRFPLLGIGLLRNHRLVIDYRTAEVLVD